MAALILRVSASYATMLVNLDAETRNYAVVMKLVRRLVLDVTNLTVSHQDDSSARKVLQFSALR